MFKARIQERGGARLFVSCFCIIHVITPSRPRPHLLWSCTSPGAEDTRSGSGAGSGLISRRWLRLPQICIVQTLTLAPSDREERMSTFFFFLFCCCQSAMQKKKVCKKVHCQCFNGGVLLFPGAEAAAERRHSGQLHHPEFLHAAHHHAGAAGQRQGKHSTSLRLD